MYIISVATRTIAAANAAFYLSTGCVVSIHSSKKRDVQAASLKNSLNIFNDKMYIY